MRTFIKILRVVLPALGLALIALPSTALAASRSLPASACQTSNDAFEGLSRTGPYTSLRSSRGDYSISCPVLRDNTRKTSNAIEAFEVRVDKGDATTRSCRLSVYDGYGSLITSFNKLTSGTGLHTFSWGVLGVSGLTSSSYYNVDCSLGGNDVALGLNWIESTDTGSDTKIVPGTYCKQAAGIYDFRRPSDALYADASPFSDTGVQMHCAPLRDVPTAAGFQNVLVRMYTDDMSGFGCQLILADSDSNYLTSISRSPIRNGNSTISYGINHMRGATAHAGLECFATVAGHDRIYSVYWEE